MNLEITLLNKLLNILFPHDTMLLKYIKTIDGNKPIHPDMDGLHGETNQTWKVYQIVSQPELFIKIEYNTNSYGYDEFPVGVQIVKAKEKKVTVYE